jgi:hypothetical protein
MKKSLVLLAVLALAAVVAVPASAQSSTLKANIPFEFSAGSRVMPAGDYTLDGSLSSSVVLIRSVDSSSAGYLSARASLTAPGASSEQDKLIFHRVGDQYFLRQIVDGSRSLVRDIPMSSTERELAGSVTSAKAYETVVILARL